MQTFEEVVRKYTTLLQAQIFIVLPHCRHRRLQQSSELSYNGAAVGKGEVVFALSPLGKPPIKRQSILIPFRVGRLRKQLDKCLRKAAFRRAGGLCKWVLQKALFCVFVSPRMTSYTVMHMPPCWVTGTCQLAELHEALGEGS